MDEPSSNNSTNNFNNISIDELLNDVKVLLSQSRENYPVLSNVWEKYINIKIKNLIDTLYKAKNYAENVDSTLKNDISKKTLAFLYIMNNSMLHGNTVLNTQ